MKRVSIACLSDKRIIRCIASHADNTVSIYTVYGVFVIGYMHDTKYGHAELWPISQARNDTDFSNMYVNKQVFHIDKLDQGYICGISKKQKLVKGLSQEFREPPLSPLIHKEVITTYELMMATPIPNTCLTWVVCTFGETEERGIFTETYDEPSIIALPNCETDGDPYSWIKLGDV